MKLYFSTQQFTALQSFDFKSRQDILFIAKSLFTPVEKLIINLIKLLILIPPFILFARLSGWQLLWPILGLIGGYFVLLQPVLLTFANRHLTQAIKRYNLANKKEAD